MSELDVNFSSDTVLHRTREGGLAIEPDPTRTEYITRALNQDLAGQYARQEVDSVIEASPLVKEAGRKAADFIREALGVVVDPDVIVHNKWSEHSGLASENGKVHLYLGNFRDYTEELFRRAVVTHVVHEKAHAIPSGLSYRLSMQISMRLALKIAVL